jgi:signal transduction histidine kinase
MHKTIDSDYLAVDAFDREYGLEELLPLDFIEDTSRVAAQFLSRKVAILQSEGSVLFRSGSWPEPSLAALAHLIKKDHPEVETRWRLSESEDVLLFPLIHELEPKGYLAIEAESVDGERQIAAGRAAGFFLQQFMHLKHQTLLTAGLHGTVVAESYTQLKEKAEQLALSEEKYRKLAGSLEIEVKRKTEEFRLAQAHMMHQEKLAAIGQLSAGMAHEINNPLGFILSNLKVLKGYGADIASLTGHYSALLASLIKPEDETTSEGAVQKKIQTITSLEKDLDFDFLLSDLNDLIKEAISGAERIQKIIHDLKTVARPGIKDEEIIDINHSIEAVLTVIGNRLGNGLDVVTTFGQVPLVQARAQDLNHVWLSLIINAIDAIDTKGTITIETRNIGDTVEVRVTDTGCGIPAEHLSKIFDPFFTTKDVGKGMGLGLHLVYNLINRLQGHIQVDSKVGQGTCFSVQLPVLGEK